MAREKHICTIATGSCIGCGTCVAVCPTGAARESGGLFWIEPENCVGCDECLNLCPKMCIYREEVE